jgi:hypothetical protein
VQGLSLSEIAADVGATDLFVLAPVESGRLFNVDGVGRGAGWAGNVSLSPDDEPVLMRAFADLMVTLDSGHPRRVFGPYWARRAATVVDVGTVVVFGGDHLTSSAELLSEAAAAARRAATRSISPTKLEADQAEIDQARRTVEGIREMEIADRALQLAETAAAALGCEYAAVYLPSESSSPYEVDRGWRPVASPEEVAAALLPLWQASRRGTFIEQDVSRSAHVHRPLGWDDGVVSAAAAPLGYEGEKGVLVVVHTGLRPRGFTDLCARVLHTVSDAGTDLLRSTANVK